MKRSFLLLGLLPAVVLANAIRPAEPAAEKSSKSAGAAKIAVPASERWKDISKADDASFRRHVVPLMSRSGCSGRECHGSFQGRGGFQLSLFGYDFEKDHEAITKGKGGAEEIRVDLKEPMKSLILAKPSLDGEEHKGKKRFDKGSWEYNLILKWLQTGAKSDVAETGAFAKLEVLPKELVFKKSGDAIQLKVLAFWKDGTVEDVTQLTRFRTNDETVALVNDTGLVTSKTPGDTHIVAFYDNGVEPVTATKVDELVVAKLRKTGILPSEICTDSEFLRRAALDVTGTLPTAREVEAFAKDTAPDKRKRKIDELLTRPAYAAWWTTKLCDFTGNNPRHIRANGNNGKNLSGAMSHQWYDWIYKRIAENTPYDQLAAGIVLATSRTSADQKYADFVQEMGSYFRTENPAEFAKRPNLPWYWMRQNVQKPEEKALSFAHTFLGVRIECAQCHKHPFDQWTKTDFEHFQAFFSGVAGGTKGGGEKMSKGDASATVESGEMTPTSLRAEIKAKVDKAMEGKVEDPKKDNERQKIEQTEMGRRISVGEPIPWDELYVDIKRVGRPMKQDKKDFQNSSRVITPKILGGTEVMMSQYNDPRAPLMDWLRSKENPYFAKAFVNRVWASYFNRGIVEPADDLNLANAPSNAELFNYLADGFIAHHFDIKWLHREILNSDTYQRSWKTNATNKLDEKNFSHAVIRRLPAEVVFDAIAMATASTDRAEKFATEITERTIGPNAFSGYGKNRGGGDGYALTIFGKPAREVNCDCERTTDPTLLQTIYTRNDPGMLSKLEGFNRTGWMDEVRSQLAPAQDRSVEAIRGRIAKIDAKAAEMLKEPEAGNAEAETRYQEQMKQYANRVAEAKTMRADLAKQLAEADKPQRKFDLDTAIGEIFLRTVSRPATTEEIAQAKADIAAAKTPVDGIRDLLWAMLNTREFMVNH
jgi:hypothetical protein